MLVIDTAILDKLIDFANKVIDNPVEGFILVIILLIILLIVICILYRKSKILQLMINIIENIFFPLIKKERVIISTFTKNKAVTKEIEERYSLVGYKKINLDYYEKFKNSSWINQKRLQRIVDKKYKNMIKAEKGIKNKDALVYIGFPHIPFAILDGKIFSSTDNVVLYDYKGALTNSSDKNFFELENSYNSDIEIITNYQGYNLKGNEIILKIEQSFSINDEEIKDVVGDLDVIYLKNRDIKRWGINSYAEVDKFVKKFYNVLQWAKENEIKKIHLVATTPVSLTFSLGRVIEHYHPEIIVYNYNNNIYDWCVNLNDRKVYMLEKSL